MISVEFKDGLPKHDDIVYLCETQELARLDTILKDNRHTWLCRLLGTQVLNEKVFVIEHSSRFRVCEIY